MMNLLKVLLPPNRTWAWGQLTVILTVFLVTTLPVILPDDDGPVEVPSGPVALELSEASRKALHEAFALSAPEGEERVSDLESMSRLTEVVSRLELSLVSRQRLEVKEDSTRHRLVVEGEARRQIDLLHEIGQLHGTVLLQSFAWGPGRDGAHRHLELVLEVTGRTR